MTEASGIFKQLKYKVESTYGTKASASSAQLLRRVQSTLDLSKDTYQSNEIRPDQQMADFRHGVRRVGGAINGELSAKTYQDFMAAILKRDFTAVTAMSGLSITIAGSGPYTITRSAGSFLTDGVKLGMVLRLTAGSFNAANLNKNVMVVGLTATVATVIVLNGSSLTAEGPIASATVSMTGKRTYIPQTGHTDKSFSIEHYYSDLVQSEVFTGCKPTTMALDLPATGMATVNFDFVGKDMETASSEYFTSPTAITTTGCLASVNGVVRAGSSTMTTITGLTVNVAAAQTGDARVGSNTIGTQFAGRVLVTGQFTAYFDSVTLRDAFVNETELDLHTAFTADNTAASDFVAISLPRIKLGSASKSDGETGIVQTFQYQALLDTTGGSGTDTDATTIAVQDSQAT